MVGHRARVAAGDRSRQRRLTPQQRVLQRGAGQRADHSFGDAARILADGLLAEQLLTPSAARRASTASSRTVTT